MPKFEDVTVEEWYENNNIALNMHKGKDFSVILESDIELNTEYLTLTGGTRIEIPSWFHIFFSISR